jgi:hypothetical protein
MSMMTESTIIQPGRRLRNARNKRTSVKVEAERPWDRRKRFLRIERLRRDRVDDGEHQHAGELNPTDQDFALFLFFSDVGQDALGDAPRRGGAEHSPLQPAQHVLRSLGIVPSLYPRPAPVAPASREDVPIRLKASRATGLTRAPP